LDTKSMNNEGGIWPPDENKGPGRQKASEEKGQNGLPGGAAQSVMGSLRGAIALLLVALFTTVGILGLSAALHSPKYSDVHARILENPYVSAELVRFTKNVNRFYLYYGGDAFALLPDGQKVTAQDIKERKEELLPQLIQEERALNDEYYTKMQDSAQYVTADDGAFTGGSDRLTLDASLYDERNRKMDALHQKYNQLMAESKEYILNEKNENYDAISQYLKRNITFGYAIYDNKLDKVYLSQDALADNAALAAPNGFLPYLLDNACFYLALDDPFLNSYYFNGDRLGSSFGQNGIEGYIYIPKSVLGQSGELSGEIDRILNPSNFVGLYLVILLLSLVGGAVAAALNRKYIAYAVRKLVSLYLRQPLLMKIGLFGIFLAVLWYLFQYSPLDLQHSHVDVLTFSIFVMTCLLLYVFITLGYLAFVYHNRRKLARHPEWVSWEFVWAQRKARRLSYILTAGNPWLVALAVVLLLLIPLAGYLSLLLRSLPVTIAILGCIALDLLLLDVLAAYGRLCVGIRSVSDEKDDPALMPGEKGAFMAPVNALANIHENVRLTVEDRLKSERLKTELISNVSHDLRTPLTSIINYIALLKETSEQNVTAMKYIHILEAKSQRLKTIIEDLFEAAKLSSGSVALSLEPVNIVALLTQALGELSEKTEESGIVFRLNYSQDKILQMVDGKKLWRVFENLIGNMINYGLAGTRAYIYVEAKADGKAVIIFKNTSKYELDFEAGELFERFKRGDAARVALEGLIADAG